MKLFERALLYAAQKHAGAVRKLDGAPYLLHPMEAAQIVYSLTKDEEVLAAALLHDTVEDTDAAEEDIRELFGERVAGLVASETEDKRPDLPKSESWRIRKEESLRELEETGDDAVRYLWMGDKLSNLRGLHRAWKVEGEAVFRRFNQHDPAQHAWYYRRIDELLRPLEGTDAWREYHALVEEIFTGFESGKK